MANILTTIPKHRYDSVDECLENLRMCTGEEDEEGQWWFWLINCAHLPNQKKVVSGESVCYLVYDGHIRGYLDIVDMDLSENYRDKHRLGKKRNTYCVVMANWHPITPIPHQGFQGWRYTELRP